jgi:hypothetical protein
MRNYFAEWFERYRRRRQEQHATAIGYRYGDAPTSEEMARVGRRALEDEMRIGVQPAPPAALVNPNRERNPGQ